jgi:alkyl hydroperoxide reductase subunit AhpC
LTKPQKERTQILAVSVDSHADSQKFGEMLRKRFDGEFDFPLLEDKDHKVIDRYGIFNPDGRGWPHPATYVIDPKGIVRWKFVEVDYNKRATNEQIRRELTKIKWPDYRRREILSAVNHRRRAVSSVRGSKSSSAHAAIH